MIGRHWPAQRIATASLGHMLADFLDRSRSVWEGPPPPYRHLRRAW